MNPKEQSQRKAAMYTNKKLWKDAEELVVPVTVIVAILAMIGFGIYSAPKVAGIVFGALFAVVIGTLVLGGIVQVFIFLVLKWITRHDRRGVK